MENNLYDVVLIDFTRVVRTIMKPRAVLEDGYHSARRWRNTWEPRTYEGSSVVIVRSGSKLIGDTVLESEVVE